METVVMDTPETAAFSLFVEHHRGGRLLGNTHTHTPVFNPSFFVAFYLRFSQSILIVCCWAQLVENVTAVCAFVAFNQIL